MDKVALGQGCFFPVLQFSPYKYSTHRLLHTHYHLSPHAGTVDQIVAEVSSGLNLTPLQETNVAEGKSNIL
jgi:hypothetical protein